MKTKERALAVYLPLAPDVDKALTALKKKGTQKGHFVLAAIREKMIREGYLQPEKN